MYKIIPCRYLAEVFNECQEEWLTAALLLIAMVILTVLMQFGINLLLKLIYVHVEEYLYVPSVRPIMRVVMQFGIIIVLNLIYDLMRNGYEALE